MHLDSEKKNRARFLHLAYATPLDEDEKRTEKSSETCSFLKKACKNKVFNFCYSPSDSLEEMSIHGVPIMNA